MAHISHIFFRSDNDMEKRICRVSVGLKPAGSANLEVEIPEPFYDCLLALCQTAADNHEQKCIAELLAKSPQAPTNTIRKQGE